MATAYMTPGVYVEEIVKLPPSVAPVETAIPAFIGYTEKATEKTAGDLTLKPTRITSLIEYEQFFGKAQPETGIKVSVTITTGTSPSQSAVAALTEARRSKHILYYALQLYFDNGGGPCYIVSVGGYKAVARALVETELAAGLDPLKKEDEPTLIVIPEAQSLGIADYQSLMNAALSQAALLMDRFVIMDAHGGALSLSDPTANITTAISNFRGNGIGTNNLKYGAAYAPNLDTVLDYSFSASAIDVVVTTDGTPAAVVKLNTLEQGQNQQYQLAVAAIRDLTCQLPPSAAMAGIYASVDRARGVWKAPANLSVADVIQPSITFDDATQAEINVDVGAGKSVNAIRSFTGLGSLVWGARTLAGNDNEWRYINVRRFFIFVEESVKKATRQFVFEPNDANTWVKIQAMVENFLTTLWRAGALQGIKPEHAFYVAVGLGKTMTPLDILEGRLNVEIGMAAVRPAEFIVLKFSHKMAES